MGLEIVDTVTGIAGAVSGGGALVLGLVDHRRKSMTNFVGQLTDRLKLDEQALADRILADPRLAELAIEVIERASRTMREEKLQAITESFARAIEAEAEAEIDQAFFIARTVLELDVPHLTALRVMMDRPDDGLWHLEELELRYPSAGPLLPQLVGVLLRHGLVVQRGTFLGANGLEITPLGRIVVDTVGPS